MLPCILLVASVLLARHVLRSAVAYPVDTEQAVFSSTHGYGRKDTKVLILGGGVAGVVAARTLHEQGIDDFMILEARPELGGRLMSHEFGMDGNRWMVEVGANWVQGTQTEGRATEVAVDSVKEVDTVALMPAREGMEAGCDHSRTGPRSPLHLPAAGTRPIARESVAHCQKPAESSASCARWVRALRPAAGPLEYVLISRYPRLQRCTR